MTEYEKGWHDAFNIISEYVEKEICLVTAEMIRRMKTEDWRFPELKDHAKVTKNRSAK